ncbi:MAG: tetratricopeptide repeat protein [Anaerolineae bacterium]|nr:tetratricopeptide repeat protein [Anaerolineae bacterium]
MTSLPLLAAYLPIDRRFSLLSGEPIPQQDEGAVLVADVRGFTALGESLAQHLGPWEGAEELNRRVSDCFADLITAVHTFHGSVIRFSGDALLAFFSGGKAARRRATAAAQAVQSAARHNHPAISLRVGVGAGAVHRRLVGDPAYGLYDLVSGPALNAALVAMKQALPGGISGDLAAQPAEPWPWPAQAWDDLPEASLLPWIPPAIYARLVEGTAAFVAELRQVVPIFVQAGCSEADLADYVPRVQAVLAPYEVSLNGVDILDKGPVLVACLGAPLARGDDPLRAVGAALSLADAGQAWERPIPQRIGISMGPMYAGMVGSPARLAYTLYGDEMNVAARLMESAAPGEVRVHAGLRRLTERWYDYTPLGAVTVKGRREPVPVARLEGQRQSPGGLSKGPLVGRQRELARLETAIDAAWSGRNRVVVLSGEAGIGKSRLAEFLVQRWRERGGSAAAGQAQAAAQQQAYAAWTELLGRFFHLQGDDQDRQRLAEHVAAAEPALLPRLPLLGDVLGLSIPDNDLTRDIDARLRQASTQALVVDLLRARGEPTLLLIEDAQWLDGPSWELILAAARGLADRPALLCLTSRPIEPPPMALNQLLALPHSERIALGEFSPAEAVDLARARLGVSSLPPELAEFLQSRGQGNPFFIEELLHDLQEEGFIAHEDGQVSMARSLDQADPPDNVHAVILARVDRLDEPARLTLKVASVIGRSFAYSILRQVHPVQARQDADLLAQLDHLQIVDIVLTETPTPEPTYIFKHAITHDVTYGTLLFSQRRELHEQIARFYEERYRGRLEPYFALLAYHYSRSGNEERQVDYCLQAGQEAARRFANVEAIAFYSQALEVLERRAAVLEGAPLQDNRQRRWELLVRREALLNRTGQRDAQRRDVDALGILACEMGQPTLLLQALYRRAHFLYLVNDYEQSLYALEELMDAAKAAGDLSIEGKALHIMGQIAYYRGYCQEALEYYHQALDLFQAAEARNEMPPLLNSLGLAHYSLAAYDQALPYYEQAMEVYRQTRNYDGEVQARGNIGLVYWDCGQYDLALEQFRHILSLAQQMGNRRHEAYTLHNIGDLYRYLGQHDQAIDYLQRALHLCQEIDSSSLRGECLNNLGRVYLEQGQFAQAQSHLEQALRIRQQLDETGSMVLDRSFLARAVLEQGNLQEALAHSRRAMELLQGDDVAVDWEHQVHFNHYRVCRASSLPEEASAALERAYRTMQALTEKMSEEGRRSFLGGVWINREITMAWKANANRTNKHE